MRFVFNEKDKILVVAPHPDDETFGCGGVIIKNAHQCDVILLTKGNRCKTHLSESEISEIRYREFSKAMGLVDTSNIFTIGIDDKGVKKAYNVIKQINLREYNYIFIPYHKDIHVDHKYTNRYIRQIAKKQNSKAVLLEYEIEKAIDEPNCFFDITDVAEKKFEMIQEYKSQLINTDYYNLLKGLNKYRGAFIRTEYAESFLMVESRMRSFFKRVIGILYDISIKIRRRNGY